MTDDRAGESAKRRGVGRSGLCRTPRGAASSLGSQRALALTLTMNGGLVIVRSTLSRGSADTINLNAGGTLQIGGGQPFGVLLSGTGNLVDNGTLIFNRSNASTYSGSLSGSDAVAKQGSGALTLSGTK